MPNINPKFITFEGGEGSGKTTQSKKLYDYLCTQDIPVILTREIGGTKEAENIRKLIMQEDWLPLTELMLIIAARYEHVSKVIVPALKENKWVICDRFIDSTYAYQGNIKDGGEDLILKLHDSLIAPVFARINKFYLPDLTFFIDLPLDVSLARTKNRKDNNKFDEKGLVFHQQTYEKFKYLADKFNDRIISIDATNLTVEEIHNIIKVKALTS